MGCGPSPSFTRLRQHLGYGLQWSFTAGLPE